MRLVTAVTVGWNDLVLGWLNLRGGSADLGHTAGLSIVNACRKCGADLLQIGCGPA